MDCKSIAIEVRHEVRGRVRKDSFFVIDCDPREHFVLEALGECYVDADSMRNFEEWIRGDFKNCHLLVSLDYKYAMVRPCGENGEFFIRAGEELLPMLPIDTFLNHRSCFLACCQQRAFPGSSSSTLPSTLVPEAARFLSETCFVYGLIVPL
jgi:hypothetical protein